MMETIFQYIIYFAQSVLLLLAAPLFIGILKRLKAFIRGYEGASIFQPYYNLEKLFCKGRVISKTSSLITLIGPLISLAASIAAAFMIPVFYAGSHNFLGNIFIVVFILAIIKLFNVLLGLDCASTFGGMGSSRELFLSMFAEPIIFIIVAFLYLETKQLNIYGITSANAGGLNYSVGHVLAAIAFFGALLVENARMPVDNPETHLELTMIHEAMILDLSGPDLALLELSSYIKLMVYITILVNGFFPFGISTTISAGWLIIGAAAYIAKMLLCIGIIALLETAIAKSRLFRVPEILAAALSLGIVAIAVNYFI